MKVKVKLNADTLSERYHFDGVAAKYPIHSKVGYDNGVWAEVKGHDNDVLSLLCELCNNNIAE